MGRESAGLHRLVLHSFCVSSEHKFTDSEAEKVLLTDLPPEVAHCLVPRAHRSALHWKDRCESAPVLPAGSQPQQPSWAERCDPSFCKRGLSLCGQEPSSWHFPQNQVSEQGQKIHVSAPNNAESKASLKILVQLAHHTHSLTLPHAKESLTFVSSTWLLLWFSKSGPLPEPS